jgi:hypothetical protein
VVNPALSRTISIAAIRGHTLSPSAARLVDLFSQLIAPLRNSTGHRAFRNIELSLTLFDLSAVFAIPIIRVHGCSPSLNAGRVARHRQHLLPATR